MYHFVTQNGKHETAVETVSSKRRAHLVVLPARLLLAAAGRGIAIVVDRDARVMDASDDMEAADVCIGRS
jgi:hypothetical protein